MLPLRCIDKTIYVTGIPVVAQHHEIRSLFSAFGPVKSVYLRISNLSNYKFAFVCFFDAESANAALTTRKAILIHGRTIYVKERTIKSPIQHPMHPLKPPKEMQAERSAKNITKMYEEPVTGLDTISYDDQTLIYGTNGELRVGDKTLYSHPRIRCNRVIRVDGIPAEWRADDLYKHLSGIGLPVTATMVYDDFDERQLRQGLIQLNSESEASRLIQESLLKTPVLQLDILPSSIPSIGPVRYCYAGRFSAYNKLDEMNSNEQKIEMKLNQNICDQTMADHHNTQYGGYSIAETHEPNLSSRFDDTTSSSHRKSQYAPQVITECNAMPSNLDPFSPPIDWSPITPPSATSASPDPCVKCQMALSPLLESQEMESPSIQDHEPSENSELFMTAKQHHFNTGNTVRNNINHDTIKKLPLTLSPCFTVSAPAFKPPLFPHKPSQTIIIENIDVRTTSDPNKFKAYMSQFGPIANADLVPLTKSRARAYVTFAKPIHAELALARLGMHTSNKHQFQVRLA